MQLKYHLVQAWPRDDEGYAVLISDDNGILSISRSLDDLDQSESSLISFEQIQCTSVLLHAVIQF